MNIKSEKQYLIVELEGEIDEYVCVDLKNKIDSAYKAAKAKNMVFDFKDTTFIDSSGVGMMLGRYKKVSENDGKVFITGAKNQVNKVFEIADIYKIITPYNNLADLLEEN